MAALPGLFVVGANDANGNATGVTNPRDARLALASLLSGAGLLSGGTVTGNSSGPDIQYDIAAGAFVTARGVQATDGLYLWTNNGSVTENSADSATGNGGPAPASGSRYDLIWARAKNAASGDGFGDSDSLPEFGVTAGAAGSSPQKPYDQVPAGALVLAESLVASGDASGGDAQITMVAAGARVGTPRTTTDWNKATTPGVFYYGVSAANGPKTASYGGFTLQIPPNDIAFTQILWRMTQSNIVEQWQRLYNGTAWGVWVQTAGQPTWTNITSFPTGVTSGGNGGAAPGYTVDASGFVVLRGSVSKSSWTGGDLVLKAGSVPSPASKSTFAVANTWVTPSTTRVDVQTDGSLILEGTTSATWLALDGIRYPLS